MADDMVYIEITNPNLPSAYRQKIAGRYESDLTRMGKDIHSASGGMSRQVSYTVDRDGNVKAGYLIPRKYEKQVGDVVINSSTAFKSSTSFAGNKNVEMYNLTKTAPVFNIPFKKTAQNAKARASFLASAKKANVSDLSVFKNKMQGSVPIYDSGSPLMYSKTKMPYASQTEAQQIEQQLLAQGAINVRTTKKNVLAELPKYYNDIVADPKLQLEYLKGLFKEGDTYNKDAKKEAKEKAEATEKKKKEKEEKDEAKEKKDNRKSMFSNLKRALAVMVAIYALVKRIVSALIQQAVERQENAVNNLSLGYTASDVARIGRFETYNSVASGSVLSATNKILEWGGSEANIADNISKIQGVARAFTLMGEGDINTNAHAQAWMDNITKMHSDPNLSPADVFNAMIRSLIAGFSANNVDAEGNIINTKEFKQDLGKRVAILRKEGMDEVASIFEAYAYHLLNETNPSKRREMMGWDFREWVLGTSLQVSANPEQYGANQAFLELKTSLEALKEALGQDAIVTLAPAIIALTKIIQKWLDKREVKLYAEDIKSGKVTQEQMIADAEATDSIALLDIIIPRITDKTKKAELTEKRKRLKSYNDINPAKEDEYELNAEKWYFKTYIRKLDGDWRWLDSDDKFFNQWKEAGMPYEWEIPNDKVSSLGTNDLFLGKIPIDQTYSSSVSGNGTRVVRLEISDKNGTKTVDSIDLNAVQFSGQTTISVQNTNGNYAIAQVTGTVSNS